MARVSWMKTALRRCAVGALALLVVAFAVVQFQQHLLRWRAERLLADMREVRLYQSNWNDAQRLMRRWGTWGHYDGSCTAAQCRYEITLSDGTEWVRERVPAGMFNWMMIHKAYWPYRWLGGRYALVIADFIVEDGLIRRVGLGTYLQAPPRSFDFDDEGLTLIVSIKSIEALNPGHWGSPGSDLGLHPYFFAERPSRCMICMKVGIKYSTRTPNDVVAQITALDLSCLTRFIDCKTPGDLLPFAKQWHFYNEDGSVVVSEPGPKKPLEPCNIPAWAMARDSGHVLVVDAISKPEPMDEDLGGESNRVKLVEVLKGSAIGPIGMVFRARPMGGHEAEIASWQPEHLEGGRRYLIFPGDDDSIKEPLLSTSAGSNQLSMMELSRCGVLADSPDARREVLKGLAQNDKLRGGELDGW